MKDAEWEALCLRCGLCCHEKIIYPDELVFELSSPCVHYDEEGKRCLIYNERFEKCPRCEKVTLFKAMFADYLPSECGYVQWARKHHLRFRRAKKEVFEFGNSLSIDDEGLNQ
jgi:Uncharacterized conserved protein